MELTIKRLKAFAIDYLFILIYIAFLLTFTLVISKLFFISLENVELVTRQIIAFITLTLPVIFYFTLTENSKDAGSWGKRKLNLKVVSKNFTTTTFGQLLLRNCLKFLPWELAHFFLFQLFEFTKNNHPIPNWVLAGLIAAQGLALVYLLFLFFNKNRSVYEVLSQTRVIST